MRNAQTPAAPPPCCKNLLLTTLRIAEDDLWGTPDVRTEKKTRRAATSRVDESDGELRHNGNK